MSRTNRMVTNLKPVFYFYNRFLLPSLFLNFLLIFLNLPFSVSFTVKIVFFGLLLFVFLYTRQKSKLNFYHNLSINTPQLFITSFLMDVIILSLTYLIAGYVI